MSYTGYGESFRYAFTITIIYLIKEVHNDITGKT